MKKFDKGTSRVVFAMPFLGVAIKFPVVHIWEFLKVLAKPPVKESELSRTRVILSRLRFPMGLRAGPKGLLFRGIFVNFWEFRFYRKTKHSILQPTYFSLFGLFNIQKYGKPIEREDFWKIICDIESGSLARRLVFDGHHFMESDNFTFPDKLMMLDYGEKKTQQMILEFGERLQREFKM